MERAPSVWYGKGKDAHVWARRYLHPSHTPAGHNDAVAGSVVERTHPTAVLRRAGNGVVLDMAWTGHLQVPRHKSGMSADEMAACLPELQRVAAEYIVPQLGPGTLPEMRCFDPNRCGCLDWGGKYHPARNGRACPPGAAVLVIVMILVAGCSRSATKP